MRVTIEGTAVEIVQGDITNLDVDAVVNAANDHLWMGGGVAGAIKRSGGSEIETEAIRQGPIAIGEAVWTRAGRLKARYVIHAAVMGQDLVTDSEKIRTATRNALLRAAALGLKSIAFPAFGTGVGGFPASEAADAMVGEILAYLRLNPGHAFERIIFVLFSSDIEAAFESKLQAVLTGE